MFVGYNCTFLHVAGSVMPAHCICSLEVERHCEGLDVVSIKNTSTLETMCLYDEDFLVIVPYMNEGE